MYKKKLILFFLFFLMIALPLSKALASIGLVALVILSVLPPYQITWSCFKKNQSVWLLGLLFFSLFFSQIYTENQSFGWSVLYQHNAFLLLPLAILANKKIVEKCSTQLLQVFVMATVFNCLTTFYFYFLPDETVLWITQEFGIFKPYMPKGKNLSFGLYSPFIERIQLGNLIAVATLSSVFLIMKRYKKWMNLAFVVLLLVCSITLGGRAGQLGLFIALIVVLAFRSLQYIYPRLKKQFGQFFATLSIGSLFILLLVAPYVLYQNFPPIQKRYGQMEWELLEYYKGVERDYSHCTTVRRIVSWENSLAVIKQAPILGVGVGDYRNKMQQEYNKAPIKLTVNLHNQYLYFWACCGIVGLLLFLFIMANWLFYLNQLDNLRFIFGLAFLLCYGFVFFTDAVLQFQVDNMLFSCFFALIPCLVNNKN